MMKSCFKIVKFEHYSKICINHIFGFCFLKQVRVLTCNAHSHSYLAWWILKEWLWVKCLLKKISKMPFTVKGTMDQHLEEGMTSIYQTTLTQVVQVTIISASHISFPPDSRTHSSRELEIFMWRTTKSLESVNDSRHKHFGNQQVKLHNNLNDLHGYNFFWKVNFYFHFFHQKALFTSVRS